MSSVVGQATSFAGQCLAWAQDVLELKHEGATAAVGYEIYVGRGAATNNPKPGDTAWFGPAPINEGAGHVGVVTKVLGNGDAIFESVLNNGQLVQAPVSEFSSSNGAPFLGFVDTEKIGGTIPKELVGGSESTASTPVLTGVQQTVGKVQDLGTGVSAIGAFFNNIWQFIGNKQNWWKIFFVLIAIVLFIFGAVAWFEGSKQGRAITKDIGMAAAVG